MISFHVAFMSARLGGVSLPRAKTSPAGSARSFWMACCMILQLAHLGHAHEEAVIAVALLADRDLKSNSSASGRAARAADPMPTRAAHDAGIALPVQRILLRDDADIDQTLLEDAVLGQQRRSRSSTRRGKRSHHASRSSSRSGGRS